MSDVITTFKTNPEQVAADDKSGSGMFSDVYLTPCGEYAIKHGNYGFADGWLLYAAKLLSLPEDKRPWWAPVIHSLRVDMDTGHFTALVRAYAEVVDGPSACAYVSDLMRVIEEGLPDMYENEEYGDEFELLLEADQFDNATIECVEFLHAIEIDTDVPMFFDIPGNSMWDATIERLVLNDPCCVKWWLDAKVDMRYREQFREFLYLCAKTAPDLQLVGDW